MESVSANSAEEQKTIFTLAGEANGTTTTDSYGFSDKTGGVQEGTTLSSILSGAGGNEMLNRGSQQEPRVADCAPSVADMEELLTNIRMSNSDMFSDDTSLNNYFTGYSRPESASASSAGAWPDNSLNNTRNAETMDTFDFLVKSLWSANKYVSMLTCEQLTMLRSIRPSLLYTFLQEVAKARSDRRSRRTLPNECAFCKNNGENEECYSTHALKDWRGRVLCPVLRAFCCPRCGATGDRAHTIKYCPEPAGADTGLSSRRRMPPSTSLLMGGGARPHGTSPATTPNNNLSYSALWSNFNIN